MIDKKLKTYRLFSVAVIFCFLICWTPYHLQRIAFVIVNSKHWFKVDSTHIDKFQENVHILAGKLKLVIIKKFIALLPLMCFGLFCDHSIFSNPMILCQNTMTIERDLWKCLAVIFQRWYTLPVDLFCLSMSNCNAAQSSSTSKLEVISVVFYFLLLSCFVYKVNWLFVK